MEHVTVPDMIRDSSLAYRDTDGEGRQVYCPICLKYRAGDSNEIINMYRRLSDTHKSIARHLSAQGHKQAFEEGHRKVTRDLR